MYKMVNKSKVAKKERKNKGKYIGFIVKPMHEYAIEVQF